MVGQADVLQQGSVAIGDAARQATSVFPTLSITGVQREFASHVQHFDAPAMTPPTGVPQSGTRVLSPDSYDLCQLRSISQLRSA